MTYADPHACPACRGMISDAMTCPRCGFDLRSVEAQRLWGLFVEADRLVAQGRARQQVAATTPAAAPAGSTAGAAPLPTAPMATPTPTPARTWSTGSILLGLGAVCLVVAGIIFATVAWGSLGVLGRAAILLAVTALVAVAARWATRRGLDNTAEALWAVFLGFVTVDLLAAVAEGLFGLGWSDFALVSVVWTAVLAAAGVAIVRWGEAPLGRRLVTPQLAAGFAPFVSAPAVMVRLGELGEGDDHWFWAAAVALVLPLAVAAVAHRTRLQWMLWPSAVLVLLFAVALVALAIDASQAGSPVLRPSEALPTVALAALAAAGAVVLPRLRVWLTAFAVSAVLYLVGVAVQGGAWSADVATSAAGLAAVAVVVALLAWLVVREDAWSLGARWAAVAGGTAALLWCGAVAFSNVERAEQAGWFSSPSDVWVRPDQLDITEGWWVLAVAVPLIAAWLATARWPSPTLAPPEWRVPVALVAAGAAVVTAVSASTLPFLVHAVALVAVGAALAVALRSARWEFSIVPVAVVALAMVVVPLGGPVTAWAWGIAAAGALVCAVVGLEEPPGPRRAISAAAAGLTAFAIVATVAQVADLADVAPGAWGLIVVGVAAGLLLLTLALDELPWHRTAVEVVVAATLLVTVVREGDDLALVSLLLTIGAVASAVVGLLDDDRIHLRWVAAGLTGAAWVARLAASDVETVEAYTAPFAVAVLAAGWWHLRSDPTSRTWSALAPGLLLTFLPSLPQALEDPTSLRALLLGLVAAASLATGLVLRWGAPVIAGAAVLLVLVLANVGPTALGLQRWILIAIAGLILLVVGTTWEKRVAEGRALLVRIAALR
ncbi:SCO7613 C-terminal domain-containing membrane protein [Aeromicrobium choanae]|uniref:Uncharacterized protein n=1 Tax=Aeromicrobium choanae TaxID=1736691 RepID=A0A1T4YNS7_9ACTN|nr:hypothetical protein [Aeromicrobium choanae]SKB02901.1 hypothetical protein SAMN06295964_0083 [Aeromicrobium choanae]